MRTSEHQDEPPRLKCATVYDFLLFRFVLKNKKSKNKQTVDNKKEKNGTVRQKERERGGKAEGHRTMMMMMMKTQSMILGFDKYERRKLMLSKKLVQNKE